LTNILCTIRSLLNQSFLIDFKRCLQDALEMIRNEVNVLNRTTGFGKINPKPINPVAVQVVTHCIVENETLKHRVLNCKRTGKGFVHKDVCRDRLNARRTTSNDRNGGG